MKSSKEITPEQVVAGVDALLDFQFAVIDAMNRKGMSQETLADLSGVRVSTVKNMFSSDAIVNLDTVGKILKAVGLKQTFTVLHD
jgi:ribosome-binding protein aMBF1 (putative translation factor)